MDTELYQLYIHTRIQVKRAFDLACAGHKDEARDFLRYVRNARIVPILRSYSGPLLVDAPFLDYQLRELERQCHPSTNNKLSDLTAIRTSLDRIAAFVAALPISSLPAQGMQPEHGQISWGKAQRRHHRGTSKRNVSQGGGDSLASGGDSKRSALSEHRAAANKTKFPVRNLRPAGLPPAAKQLRFTLRLNSQPTAKVT